MNESGAMSSDDEAPGITTATPTATNLNGEGSIPLVDVETDSDDEGLNDHIASVSRARAAAAAARQNDGYVDLGLTSTNPFEMEEEVGRDAASRRDPTREGSAYHAVQASDNVEAVAATAAGKGPKKRRNYSRYGGGVSTPRRKTPDIESNGNEPTNDDDDDDSYEEQRLTGEDEDESDNEREGIVLNVMPTFVRHKRLIRRIAGLTAVFILFLIVTAIFSKGTRKQAGIRPPFHNNHGDNQVVSSSSVPSSSGSMGDYISFLSAYTPRATLDDASTPQHRAMRWLMTDDFANARLDEIHANASNNGHVDSMVLQSILARYALATFYYATGGPTSNKPGEGWNVEFHWVTSTHLCGWYGVTCTIDADGNGIGSPPGGGSAGSPVDSTNGGGSRSGNGMDGLVNGGHVEALQLVGNNLRGTIPDEISLLKNIGQIDLGGNFLTGPLPAAFGSLHQLTELAIEGNELKGSVPKEVCQLTTQGEGGGSLIQFAADCTKLYCPCCTECYPATGGNSGGSIAGEEESSGEMSGNDDEPYDNDDAIANNDPVTQPDNNISGESEGGEVISDEQMESFVLQMLSPISTVESLQDPQTPQHKALQWLMLDDALSDYLGQPYTAVAQETGHADGNGDGEHAHMSKIDFEGTPIVQEVLKRYALATLYFATSDHGDDDSWTKHENWLSAKHVCEWFGVKCVLGDPYDGSMMGNGSSGEEAGSGYTFHVCKYEGVDCVQEKLVTELRLVGNHLRGVLPDEVMALVDLVKLDFSNNGITGFFPNGLSKLTKLVDIRLRNNLIGGDFDVEAFSGSAETLEVLLLDSNRLEGSIPKAINKLTSMYELRLSDNSLGGHIPDEIGDLSTLLALDLSNNQMVGTLPESIGSLKQLQELILSSNALYGSIPDGWYNLGELEELRLDDNDFEGPIPKWIDGLVSLRGLYLDQNEFKGEVPVEINVLSELEELTLEDNDLHGSIPSTVCELNLRLMSADCAGDNPQIVCDCCTECFQDGVDPDIDGPSLPFDPDGDLDGGSEDDGVDVVSVIEPSFDINEDGTPQSGDSMSDFIDGDSPVDDGEIFTPAEDDGDTFISVGQNNDDVMSAALKFLGRFSDPKALEDTASPQHQAMSWLVNADALSVYLDDSGASKLSGHDDTFDFEDTPLQLMILERYALATLYYATNGQHWDNGTRWLTKNHQCLWHGVRCRVAEDEHLSGYPVCDFDGVSCVKGYTLSDLRLSGNNLQGVLPDEIGLLKNGGYIDLASNKLTGAVPRGLANLENLAALYLSSNMISGNLDLESFPSHNLEVLRLDKNAISGPLPNTIKEFSFLYALRLGGNSLTGSLPPEVGMLGKLMELDLSDNQFLGGIPEEIGQLGQLQRLQLSGNALNGEVPDALSNLVELEELRLDDNGLSGKFPSWLSNLMSLKELYLDTNEFSGQIPDELGQLTELEELTVEENSLSGSIPSSLCTLKLLLLSADCGGDTPAVTCNCCQQCFPLGEESLEPFHPDESEQSADTNFNEAATTKVPTQVVQSGTTPAVPATAAPTQNTLTSTAGGNNSSPADDEALMDLAFKLAYTLSSLTSLETENSPQKSALMWLVKEDALAGYAPFITKNDQNFDFESTKLKTRVLERYALATFYYATGGTEGSWKTTSNWLSEKPVCEWYGVTCDIEDFHGGGFTTPNFVLCDFPGIECEEKSSVTELRLVGNNIQGPFIEELSVLVDLEKIDFTSNALSGEIPSSLSQLQQLEYLRISNNQISGTLDFSRFGNPGKIEVLRLDGNLIQGSIPTSISLLESVYKLNLSDNKLNGKIPAQLASLQQLLVLELSDNQLTGNIPSEVGDLKELQTLRLSNNALSGTLPSKLAFLGELEELLLNGNKLDGVMPSEWVGNLVSLRSLHLDHNEFTGFVSEELGSLQELDELTLEYNDLIGTMPPSVCALQLRFLTADCTNEMACDCCTGCFPNGEEVNVESSQAQPETTEGPTTSESVTTKKPLSIETNDNDEGDAGNSEASTPFIGGSDGSDAGTNFSPITSSPSEGNSNQSGGGDHFPDGPGAGTQEMYYFALAFLGQITDLRLLQDESSPQGMARKWLERDSVFEAYASVNPEITDEVSFEGIPLEETVKERYSLATLYYSTNGPSIDGEDGWIETTRWLSDDHLCEWNGIYCTSQKQVVSLKLADNRLTGSLTSEIRLLTSLQSLDLSNNYLSGKVPPEVGDLVNLTEIRFEGNELTGEIPLELCTLGEKLYHLSADCLLPEPVCSCCTICFKGRETPP